MSDKLGVGIIGLGGIARTHIPGWVASEHAELVAGCDIDPEILPLWGEKHNISKLTTDPMELIDDPDVDIVDVCTPNMYHTEQTVAALDAGKHVLCEKPLAPTPDDIRKMIAARDRSGKLLMTAQHQRFRGISQALKAEIETGALGDVYHARSWMLRRGGLPVRPTFIYKQHSGGGPCIDIGVHVLDLTLWLMGHPKPVAVSGVARAALAHHEGAFSGWGKTLVPEDIDVEDFAAALVRFENGASLILEVSWLLHHDVKGPSSKIWLYGTEGGCEWPDAKVLATNYETRQHYTTTLQITGDAMEPHALECFEFARAVAEGDASPVPAEESLYVQAILDGIYRSQEAGREVDIDVG